MSDLVRMEKQSHKDRSELIRRLLADAIQQWKENNAVEQLRGRKVSLGKAAEFCGISLGEMMELASRHNVDWIGYTKEDLEKDLG